MKPHESPRIRKKSIRGDSGDSWPVWNRGTDGQQRHSFCIPPTTRTMYIGVDLAHYEIVRVKVGEYGINVHILLIIVIKNAELAG